MNREIFEITHKIVDYFQPEKIILFGSHAYGHPTENSDVDLLVIMNHQGSARWQAAKILQTIDYHFPLDLIVRSGKQLANRIQAGDYFLREIIEKGTVLYEQAVS